MPILAVTLGAEDDEEVAAHNLAPNIMLPTVSEAMRLQVMQLIWANFEVSKPYLGASLSQGDKFRV